jgi:uncharacterized protein
MIGVCPKCDVPLLILRFKNIDVDFCERCRGFWLDAGELEALLEVTEATAASPLLRFQQEPGVLPNGRPHLCPRCDEPLREIQVGPAGSPSLTLDKCPREHGLWFDADELERLLSMVPSERGAAKAIDYLNELFGMKSKT